jgi:hypothetical protein
MIIILLGFLSYKFFQLFISPIYSWLEAFKEKQDSQSDQINEITNTNDTTTTNNINTNTNFSSILTNNTNANNNNNNNNNNKKNKRSDSFDEEEFIKQIEEMCDDTNTFDQINNPN